MIEEWIGGILGVWILLSPWILGFSEISIAKWSNVLCGLAFILMDAWVLFGEKSADNKGQPKQEK